MSGDLSIADFEAFKKTPEAKAPPLPGLGDFREKQAAIIARDEAAGYREGYEGWDEDVGSTGYSEPTDEELDRADRKEERQLAAAQFEAAPSSTSRKGSRTAAAMEASRVLLAEQEFLDAYGSGYTDGYEDGKAAARQTDGEAVAVLREQLGEAQLEIIRLSKMLAR